MTAWPILSLTSYLPLVGAAFILTIRGEPEVVARNSRNVALWTTLVTFVLSLFIWFNFDPANPGFQMEEKAGGLAACPCTYHVGVDGISMLFVMLSTFLMPLCILASWDSIKTNVKEYMISFMVLETMMVGMFCALDFVLFYLFFEGVLIPMFIIIGIWGGSRRVYAAFKFFLYTLLGSVLMLLAVLVIYFIVGTTDIPPALGHRFPLNLQTWLWLAFFASFAVKVPMWPVHTWLPDAHVEAPTAGSVILAGVLLKMGAYGFLRFSIPMLPDATAYFTPMVYTLSIIAVIYASLVALAQDDLKKLIAYSSVAHMGYVTVGMFTLTPQGIQGSLIQMLSHGVVSASLFLCVGALYDRLHTREIARYGGVVKNMPRFALVFMIMLLAAVGLPGTSGFIGEFLIVVGAFQVNTWVATLTASGIVLGCTYMLWAYRRVVFGKLVADDVKAMRDLEPRELLIFAPMIAVVLWMGIYPASFLGVTAASVEALIHNYHTALAAPAAAVLAGP